jgi:hypothetical protein
MVGASSTQEYKSAKIELFVRILNEVKSPMAESKIKVPEEFWLFHDLEEEEKVELRKFIDPELDLKSVQGIDKLLDKLNHLLE